MTNLLNQELKEKIEQSDIISFDMFDTLILRPYISPEHLFDYIENKYKIKNFSKLRKKAAQKAWQEKRNINKEDTTLNEIYEYIPEKYNYVKNIEIELEIKQTILNNQMFEVYKYAQNCGKRILIVTDMYLQRDIINKILISKGITNFELFISCECGKLKMTGNLFKHILSKLEIQPETILHIGDNINSDYYIPKKLNLNVYHYPKVFDTFIKKHKRFKLLLKKHKNNLSYSITLMLTAIYCTNSTNYWETFAYLYTGYTCLGFTQWIYNDLTHKNINDIIFIARDGYLLKKVFNIFYENQYNTAYIYAPRLLNLCCRMDYAKHGYFGLDHTKNIVDYYRSKSNIINNLPEIKTAKDGRTLLKKYSEDFEQLKANEIKSYQEYLSKYNFTGKTIATIDSVSKFFSAQKLFMELLKPKQFIGYYYLIQKNAHLKNINVKSFKKISPYSEDLRLIEFMMTSPEAPIKTVSNGTPIYKIKSKFEENRIKTFEHIENGCIDFAKDIKTYFGTPEILQINSNNTTDLINNFINHPEKEDKKYFSQVPFAYDTNHSEYKNIFDWGTNNYHSNILLFGAIPIIKVIKHTNKTKYKFLGITILKIIKCNPKKKKFFLFGIILLCKSIRKNKYEQIY